MNDHCCKGCDYFAVAGVGERAGECRRYPPQRVADANGRVPCGRAFPTVYAGDWCGEHRPVRLAGATLTPREARHVGVKA